MLRFLMLSFPFLLANPIQAAEPSRPNVVIVLLDDVGYGDFSCLGNPVIKTPAIDQLHQESTRLIDFHVAPMCTPTRGQIMTGRDALANGAMNVSSGRTPLKRGIPTMADLYAGAGYRTGHFGKWHLGDNYPYRPQERGFQETLHDKSWGIGSAAEPWNNDCFNDHYFHNGKLVQMPGYNTDVYFSEAMKWMKAKKDQPFLVYLPLTAAHGPHFVPDRYRALYKNQKPNVASFYGMIANIDENLTKLDAFLKSEDLRDNTILIFLTDNGGTSGVPVFNAGMRGSKTQYYEGGHRVPCFVRWPGGPLRSAGDLLGLTQAQDLLPTLLELCGVKSATPFDGVSLAAALRDAKASVPDRTLVVQYSRIPMPRPQKGDACVMWQQWRLVENKELYDLKSDPAQKTNVIDKHPDVVQKLRAHYDRWWAGVEKGLDEFQPIHVGNDAENPVRLAPGDFQDVHCDQSAQVRRGDKKIAPWNILVEKDGDYQITLRRYPAESGLAMVVASPAHQAEDGGYPAGVALPIAKARLRIGEFDRTADVKPDDQGITFSVPLKAGRMQLHTWLLDAKGQELCSAFYAEVRRK